jgi:hypothetical protein
VKGYYGPLIMASYEQLAIGEYVPLLDNPVQRCRVVRLATREEMEASRVERGERSIPLRALEGASFYEVHTD